MGRTADLIVGRRHHCSIMLDRLTLNEDGSDHEEAGVLTEIPEEEMLRLDDGTPLPAELSELRALLQLHSATAAEAQPNADADDPEQAAQLAALASAKADMLRDCLLEFDEGMLLMHDKLLDHEALVKRLHEVRKTKTVKLAGRVDYDEAIDVGDDDDDDLSLADLLAVDLPGGAGGRSSDNGAAADDREDEELLDQRVSASRQQIKSWVRALEEGKKEKRRLPQSEPLSEPLSEIPVGLAAQARLAAKEAQGERKVGPRSVGAAPTSGKEASASPREAALGSGLEVMGSSLQGSKVEAPKELAPLRVPKKGLGTYSMRLRTTTSTWQDK